MSLLAPKVGVFPFLHSRSRRGFFPEISDLTGVVKTVLERLYVGLDNPDFNYAIVTAPADSSAERYYHWYLNIIPRLIQLAGVKLGSGICINSVSSESAAEFLRNVRTAKRRGAG